MCVHDLAIRVCWVFEFGFWGRGCVHDLVIWVFVCVHYLVILCVFAGAPMVWYLFLVCFAIYLIMLSWKTYTRYQVNIIMTSTNFPTQGQPNPRQNGLKGGIWATFFPQQIFFCGLELVLYRKQTTRNLTQPFFSANIVVCP